MDQTAIRMQSQGKQGEGEVMLPLQAVRGRGLGRVVGLSGSHMLVKVDQ